MQSLAAKRHLVYLGLEKVLLITAILVHFHEIITFKKLQNAGRFQRVLRTEPT